MWTMTFRCFVTSTPSLWRKALAAIVRAPPLQFLLHSNEGHWHPAALVVNLLDWLVAAGSIERLPSHRRHEFYFQEAFRFCRSFAKVEDQSTDALAGLDRMGVRS